MHGCGLIENRPRNSLNNQRGRERLMKDPPASTIGAAESRFCIKTETASRQVVSGERVGTGLFMRAETFIEGTH